MGILQLGLTPIRIASHSKYLHRNIPAVLGQFRWSSNRNPPSNETVNKKSKKKKGSPVVMPALTAYPQNALFNNGKTKPTDAKTNNIKNSVKINTPKTTPVVIATKEQSCQNQSKNQEVLKAGNVAQQQAPKATTTIKGPEPIQPPQPPQPPQSNYWWVLLLLAAAGGGTIAYNYDLFGSTEKKPKSAVKPEAPVEVKKKKIPETSAEIPKEVPYLLIGGGTASFAAFRAIKSHDPKAKVMVIADEIETPYMRPPLSKELWLSADTNPNITGEALKFKQWNGVERSLYYEPNDFYINPTKLVEEPNGGVAVVRGYTVKRIDVVNRTAILTDGTEIKYGECLLATGSSPRNLEVFESAPTKIREKVSVFKTIEDYAHLKEKVDQAKSVAIIGGGFLGSELACALSKYGKNKQLNVYQIFYEKGNMGKVLPEYLSKWTSERVREEGVNVIPNNQVHAVDLVNNQVKLRLSDGQEVLCDHVVVAVGARPNVNLAKDSGLEGDEKFGGYVVNAELEARRHLYVAGDAACFYDPKLGRRRVEHHDHAVVSGRLAGENMVGLKKPYMHQSMFWSDLGPKVGYEAIGIIDSSLPTVSVFVKDLPADAPTDAKTSEDPKQAQTSHSAQSNDPVAEENDDFRKGVIFYLRDDQIVGIVLWNVFNRINTARAVIAEGKKYDDLNEVAKLFEIHS